MSKLPSVIGRYQIRSRLGQGGMGYLFLAWDPVLEREVAIKRLRDDNDELRERFAREARSVARLRHPNIVTIYDVGEQDGEPFIAMEYIVGQTMAEIIRSRAPLEITRRLEIISELCDGLAFAHKAGIVHRDVKPANIIVEPEGSIKILDFGIARIAESGMTQAGMLIGTLNYMSPEQVAGLVVDSRSDIFAVGAVFYELLTYQQAFPGGLHNGILNRILNEPPLSLETACPGLDSEVIAVIDRALQKAPGSRYQDLASMRKDLERARLRLESLPKEALASQTSPPPQVGDTATTAPPAGPHATLVGDREENAQHKEILAHLDDAYRALAEADFGRASAAVRQVLALSPELAEAVELQERIRIDRANYQVQQWLARAQELLDTGAVSEAQVVADQALSVAPGLPAAVRLRKAIETARQALEQERQRAEALKAALERAASLLNEGSFEAAEQAVAEALALSPDDEDARALQQRIQRAIDEHAALEHRVDDAIREANAAAEARRYGDALALLRQFVPEHDRITAAMAMVADAERAHQEREARLREENSARALAAAEACQSHDDAIAILRTARGLDPSHEGLGRALTIREQAAAQERELAERRRLILEALAKADQVSKHDAALEVLREAQRLEPESEDVRAAIVKREAALEHERELERRARERREQIAAALAKARQTKAHDAAVALLAEALRLDPQHAELKQALSEREAALEHERELERRARERREQIAAALAKARQTKSHDAAVALLAEALRLDPQHAELRQAFSERQAALERERQARLAREREQRIAQAIKDARDLPSHDTAIALLREAQQLDPDHQELRREIEQRETALAREQEEARLRREREKKIAALIAKAQKTVSHEGAIAILQEAVGLDPDHENLSGMIEERRNALAEEQRQTEERLARIGEAITRASEMASHEMAISTLEEAHRLDSRHAGLREALERRRAALEREQAEQRRLEERRRAIADGLARAAKTSHESAVRILGELAALDPSDDRIAELLRERRSALEAEREEARQARIRQEQIAALISEAKSVTSHADAIAVLNRALALEPSNRQVKSLLDARSAALEREREEEARRQALQETRARITQLIERREFDAARAALADAERRLQAKRELRDLRKMLARTAADTGVRAVLRGNRRLQLGVAALLVLAVGVGYWIIGTPTPSPTPSGGGQQPIAETPETPAPVPPQPADVNPVPEQPPVDVPVENPAAARASRVAEVIGQARLQLTQGDLAQAAATVTKGLAADPADSQLSALGGEIVGQARAQAVKARAAADQRGEAATSSPEYRQAGQRIVDAGGHERAGRYGQAARSLLDAQGLFIRASQRTPEPPQVAEGPRPSPSLTETAAKPSPPSAPVTPPVTEPRSPEPAPAPPVAPPSTAAVPPQSTQPPATTATAKPPVSSTPSVVSDEAGVRAALRAYELAYSALNVEAVTRVYPSVNAAALRQSFDALRQQQVSIECDRIDISGITALASCQVRQSILPRAGSRRTDSIRSLFRLQKVDNGWIIVERRGP